MEIAESPRRAQPVRMGSKPQIVPPPARPELVGRRVKILREALGMTKAEFAEQIGLEPKYLTRYESGDRPLTLNLAAKICDTYGASLDFIFLGRTHSLPAALAEKIRPALNA